MFYIVCSLLFIVLCLLMLPLIWRHCVTIVVVVCWLSLFVVRCSLSVDRCGVVCVCCYCFLLFVGRCVFCYVLFVVCVGSCCVSMFIFARCVWLVVVCRCSLCLGV